jgi:hypothetical protein
LRYLARPTDARFDHLTYTEFYERYRHKPVSDRDLRDDEWEEPYYAPKPARIVKERRDHVVARLKFVPLRAGETFYLRAVLQRHPGRSFGDLRTIDGVTYPGFAEAAAALGIFDEMNEAEYVISEAVQMGADGPQLRWTFSQVVTAEIGCAFDIWTKYLDRFVADFERRNLDRERAVSAALRDLSQLLREASKASLSDFGLPEPDDADTSAVEAELFAFAAVRTALSDRAAQCRERMTEEQREAYDLLVDSLETDPADNGHFYFIEGKAGRGKSFVAHAFVDHLRGHQKVPVILGATALSVSDYARARTVHSGGHFKPATDGRPQSQSELLGRPAHPDCVLLRQADYILLEELPMLNVAVFEALDELLQFVMGNDLPFGGKRVLGIGDFRQVAPVVEGAEGPVPVFAASIRSSPLWSCMRVVSLHAPIRNAADPEFGAWVDAIGEGYNIPRVDLRDFIEHHDDRQAVADFLFPPEVLQDSQACLTRAYLAATNEIVDRFNAEMLERLPGDSSLSSFSKTLAYADSYRYRDLLLARRDQGAERQAAGGSRRRLPLDAQSEGRPAARARAQTGRDLHHSTQPQRRARPGQERPRPHPPARLARRQGRPPTPKLRPEQPADARRGDALHPSHQLPVQDQDLPVQHPAHPVPAPARLRHHDPQLPRPHADQGCD